MDHVHSIEGLEWMSCIGMKIDLQSSYWHALEARLELVKSSIKNDLQLRAMSAHKFSR